MSSPNTIPTMPRMPMVEPIPVAVEAEVPPSEDRLEIRLPMKAWNNPPISTKIPPSRDRTNAAVGLSLKSNRPTHSNASIIDELSPVK